MPMGRGFEVCKSCLQSGNVLRFVLIGSKGAKSLIYFNLIVYLSHKYILMLCLLEFELICQYSFTNFQVDVPLEVVHLTDEYWDKVVGRCAL